MEHNPSELEKGRASVKALQECIELQQRKSRDYQNKHSTVTQADYYPRGIHSINDIIQAKMLRVKSVIEAMEGDDTYSENFESLEDSYKDLINYASFAIAWIRGEMEGQDPSSGLFSNKGAGRRDMDEILDLMRRIEELEKADETPVTQPFRPVPSRPWPEPAVPYRDNTPYWDSFKIVCESNVNNQCKSADEVVDEWLKRNG